MSDVTFNEEQTLTHRYAPTSSKKGGVIGLVMRLGLAKTEGQANMVMVAIIIVAVVIMAIIWMSHGSKKSSPVIPPTNVPGAMP